MPTPHRDDNSNPQASLPVGVSLAYVAPLSQVVELQKITAELEVHHQYQRDFNSEVRAKLDSIMLIQTAAVEALDKRVLSLESDVKMVKRVGSFVTVPFLTVVGGTILAWAKDFLGFN